MSPGEFSNLKVPLCLTRRALDHKDMPSFIAESSQSILDIATTVEGCGTPWEEYHDELAEVQRQSFHEKDNPLSDEKSPMMQKKWQAFIEIADGLKRGWEAFKGQVRGLLEGDDPVITPLIT